MRLSGSNESKIAHPESNFCKKAEPVLSLPAPNFVWAQSILSIFAAYGRAPDMVERTRAQRELDICEQALALAESERAEFLDEACGDDAALRKAAQSLLSAVSESGTFMLTLPDDASKKDAN